MSDSTSEEQTWDLEHPEYLAMPIGDFVEMLCPKVELRDFLAGCALAGLLSGSGRVLQVDEEFLASCWRVADIMLTMREKKTEDPEKDQKESGHEG